MPHAAPAHVPAHRDGARDRTARGLALTLLAAVTIAPGARAQVCIQLDNAPPGVDLEMSYRTTRLVDLPFAFPFAGTNYSQITVSAKGHIGLGAAAAESGAATEALMLAGQPKIALHWWGGWEPGALSRGAVYFATTPTSAHVVYEDVTSYFSGSRRLNGEIVLTASGEIFLHYDQMVAPDGASLVGISAGGGAAANLVDLSARPALTGATGYEGFGFPYPPFDLNGRTLRLAPDGSGGYALSFVTTTPCAQVATAGPYGQPCSAVGATGGAYYEQFDSSPGGSRPVDLANRTIRFRTASPTTYVSSTGGGFDTGYLPSEQVPMGDDYVAPRLQLGFAFSYAGEHYTEVAACSNGFLRLAGTTTTWIDDRFDGPPWIAAMLTDLQPGTGAFHWSQRTGYSMATWTGFNYRGSTSGGADLQIKLFTNGDIELNYGRVTFGFTGRPIAGLGTGAGSVDPGLHDITALATTADLGRPVRPVHTVRSPPALGQNYGLELSNLGSGGSLIVLAVGFGERGVDLGAIGAPQCFDYTSQNAFLVQLVGGRTSITDGLFVPNLGVFSGVPLHTQGALFLPGINPLGILTSNGVRAVIGQ